MPIRDQIIWGGEGTLKDPRLANLDCRIREFRDGRLPNGVKGGREFKNERSDLPPQPPGYYREFDLDPKTAGVDRNKLRIVFGNGGEIYLTGDHYGNFRQIINMPS